MEITVNFSALDRAVEVMEAARRSFDFDCQFDDFEPIDAKLERGFEATLDDVDIDPSSGLLSVQGRQVLLYIQDHGWRADSVLEDSSKGNKYHVSYCQKLEQMRNDGRYERYVVTNNTSGDFFITGADWVSKVSTEKWARLNVCKYCLGGLNYKNYKSNRAGVFKAFNLDEFFNVYRSHFKHQPRRKAGSAEDEVYADNWDDVSTSYRYSVGWGCEKCGVVLNEHKNLLHTHHKNGVKGDNSSTNLAALCIVCHSEEPNHGHMSKSVSFEKRNKIIGLRRDQREA